MYIYTIFWGIIINHEYSIYNRGLADFGCVVPSKNATAELLDESALSPSPGSPQISISSSSPAPHLRFADNVQIPPHMQSWNPLDWLDCEHQHHQLRLLPKKWPIMNINSLWMAKNKSWRPIANSASSMVCTLYSFAASSCVRSARSARSAMNFKDVLSQNLWEQ